MRLDLFGRQQEQESHLEQPGPSGKGIADIKGRALRTRGDRRPFVAQSRTETR